MIVTIFAAKTGSGASKMLAEWSAFSSLGKHDKHLATFIGKHAKHFATFIGKHAKHFATFIDAN